jgi:phosphoglycerate dehydrogenase-like enzyme
MTVPVAPDRPNQHNDLPGSSPFQPRFRPTPGPIAVAPEPLPLFVDAARAAGATVEPLSEATRGLIWLSEQRSDELAAILAAHPGIEWVQLPWAGVDGFGDLFATLDHDHAPVFTSAKGSYAEPVAEHALALTLSVQREVPSKSRAAHWQSERTGLSLFGNHVVIVGAGGIAVELLRLLEPFRVRTTVVRRVATPLDGATKTVTVERLAEVLPTADVVVLAAASTGQTRHLIGAAELAQLSSHAVIVNVARGALIDDVALVESLRADRIWGAGIDVTEPEPLPADHPLWAEPRCVITSHSADTPLMTKHLLATRIERNVRAFLGGEPFVGLVDTRAGY